ncbi:MAG: hypothetical protein GXO01_01510 [Epsilonproteobacteria bacterium]|nr:hypothetical protein [Campylobacterota bacterium]
MESTKKTLKTLYSIQIALGGFATIFLTLFLAIMATDAPGSGNKEALLGGLLGFAAGSILMIFLPLKAYQEIEKYPNGRLIFNYITTIANLFTLNMIFSLIQIALLFELKRFSQNG